MKGMPSNLSALVVVIIGAGALTACQTAEVEPPESFLAGYKVAEPTAAEVTVCHGYNCRYRSRLKITPADLKDIGAIFDAAPTSPVGERTAMSEAIGLIEKKTGVVIGTSDDEGGTLNHNDIGNPSKQDCVDEAATATSYLLMMQQNGFFKHHRVVKPRVRGIFIDGRWQHFTAVVRETASGDDWAIDSWFRPNGQPAVVMTIGDWLTDYAGVEAKQLPADS